MAMFLWMNVDECGCPKTDVAEVMGVHNCNRTIYSLDDFFFFE